MAIKKRQNGLDFEELRDLVERGLAVAYLLAMKLWERWPGFRATGWSQKTLAERLNTTQTNISNHLLLGEYFAAALPPNVKFTVLPAATSTTASPSSPTTSQRTVADVTTMCDIVRPLRTIRKAAQTVILGHEVESLEEIGAIVDKAREGLPEDDRKALDAGTLTTERRDELLRGLTEEEARRLVPAFLTVEAGGELLSLKPRLELDRAIDAMPLPPATREAIDLIRKQRETLAEVESDFWQRPGEGHRDGARRVKKAIDAALALYLKHGSTAGRKPDTSASALLAKAAAALHRAVTGNRLNAARVELGQVKLLVERLQRELGRETKSTRTTGVGPIRILSLKTGN